MKYTNYVPLSSAISDYIEDYQFDEEIDESLLTKWATDILRQLETDSLLCNKIAILDIVDYKVKLPEDFKMICEIAYRAEGEKCPPKRRSDKISQWVANTQDNCELEINVKCDCGSTDCRDCDQNHIEIDVDRMWELANPWYNYSSRFARVSRFGEGKSSYTSEFKLLKYDGNSPWSGIQLHLNDCANVHCPNCEHTYRFHTNNIEVNSIKKGEVLISYLASVRDENGDIQIPDDPIVIEAVGDYILYKMMRKDYFAGGKEAKDYRAYKDAEQVHYTSLGRARSKLDTPSYQTFTQWLKNNRYSKMQDAYCNLLDGCEGTPSRKYSHQNKYRNTNY